MSQEQYNLVFSGQIAPGFDLPQVKKNIQALFRIDDAKVEVLFSGKAITLKKALSLDVATKYRVAMKKAGARADLILSQELPSEPTTSAKSTAQPVPVKGVVNQAESASFQTSLGAQPDVADTPRGEIDAPDFGVAEMSGDLLKPDEKTVVTVVEVDTSALSVADQQGNLVEDSELLRPEAVNVDIPDIEIAPVGSDVLSESERKKVTPVVVDISALSIAEVGGKLSPDAPKSPAAPDVSHIHLKD